MAEESLHALQPSELSWNENLMEVATMISLMDFAYLKEQGLGEDNPKWEWIIENKLSFPRRQQFSTGTVLFPVVGWERDVLKGLWASFLWGMSVSAYRHQLSSHAFYLQHLLHLYSLLILATSKLLNPSLCPIGTEGSGTGTIVGFPGALEKSYL